MFWQSVFNGLSVLLHWQTYVVAFIYFIISFIPIAPIIIARNNAEMIIYKGRFLMMIFQPFFQALAVFISVCILFPIMLGGVQAAWSLPWMVIFMEPWRTLLIIVIMCFLSALGEFIPFLGKANSFIMFIMGGTVLVFLILSIHNVHPDLGITSIDFIPSLLTIIGIVIVSGFFSWLGVLVSSTVVTLIFMDWEDISEWIIIPIGSVFGFIPIFIYAAWIGLQVNGLK